ncbi:MAG: glutamine--fructose-6-phosphate transaminase (isomerizing) [Candidatus Aminicenantales bacterium]
MCGIIGYIGSKDIVPVLLKGLKKLEYRGYDSAGIAVVDRGKLHIRRVKGKISLLEKNVNSSPLNGKYGVGHTRWATHGRPSEENAHPHQDCSGTLVVVHNGIIENYLVLKQRLEEEGHQFKTETDTEVIAHLVEKYFEGSLEEATLRALKELEGAYAVAVISTRDPQKIVAAKFGPPAVVGLGENENFISSDINPLLSYTRRIAFLEDSEMAIIEQNEVEFRDFGGNKISKKVEDVSWSPLMIEKRGYKHFMLKEIFEQPQVVRDTLFGRTSLESGEVFFKETNLPDDLLKRIRRVAIVACGTSFHAGLVGKYMLETLVQIPVDVEFSSEYRYRDFILNDDTLVIVISQSGETADSLAALRKVKEKGCPTFAISNVVRSSIARESDGVLYTHAGPEIGVAATKTFTAQMAALALLALYMGRLRGRIKKEENLSLIQELQRLPHKMEKILNRADSIEELALDFSSFSHFLYLGRWVSYPVAMEGALKLKEISYIHAEAYPGGEMKHGPIALIDEQMPTMTVIPRDRVYEKMLSNISEIKTRNGYVLAVAFESDEEIKSEVERVLPIPETHQLFTPFLAVLPLQLFAYYIANRRGADVDQPRNLAKSVTVE